MYGFNDEMSLRAGKFQLDYGIYFIDHTVATRQGIGFGEGTETFNLEWNYQSDKWSGAATLDLGRLDNPQLDTEKGGALSAAYAFAGTYKVGWSGYYGTQNGNNRQLTGPYALLGFTPHFYFLGEADLQFIQPGGGAPATNGIFSYEKLGYELVQGLIFYGMQENFVPDFGSSFTRVNVVGFGTQWFPRPHLEVQLEYQQQYSPMFPSAQNFAFLMGSFYL